jgi:hypothetical protein
VPLVAVFAVIYRKLSANEIPLPAEILRWRGFGEKNNSGSSQPSPLRMKR